MNLQIEKLYAAVKKPSRRVIGLMSGTSLDGLDIALCTIHGSGNKSRLILEQFITIDYSPKFRNQIREIFAKREIDQQVLCGLNAHIGNQHGAMVNTALKTWGITKEEIDCVASHGQTVYHAPKRLTDEKRFGNSTLQIGDGDHIAVTTGIVTISDFRQKHIAAGGEGAPLAAYGDFLLFTDEIENRILLNIGGISNFTFLPNKNSGRKAYATDLGPGNTMMNQFALAHYGIEMDKDARIAKNGSIDNSLLAGLLEESFLGQEFPKTTGPELFNLQYLKKVQERTRTTEIANDDVMATLNMFAAQAIAQGVKKATQDVEQYTVYVSGGGLHNKLLLEHLQNTLAGVKVTSFSELGINPDAKEACLFAVLANETLAGGPTNVETIRDSPAVCMGKLSFPY